MGDLPVMSREALMELSKERRVAIVLFQAQTVARQEKRIEELETRLNANSSNSNQPPSSDSPYQKPVKPSGKKGQPGAKKGHQGHRQQMLEAKKPDLSNLPLAPVDAAPMLSSSLFRPTSTSSCRT